MADCVNHRVREIREGVVRTLAGDGRHHRVQDALHNEEDAEGPAEPTRRAEAGADDGGGHDGGDDAALPPARRQARGPAAPSRSVGMSIGYPTALHLDEARASSGKDLAS